MYTTCMTVYLVNSLPKTPYIHRIYMWFWPSLVIWAARLVPVHADTDQCASNSDSQLLCFTLTKINAHRGVTLNFCVLHWRRSVRDEGQCASRSDFQLFLFCVDKDQYARSNFQLFLFYADEDQWSSRSERRTLNWCPHSQGTQTERLATPVRTHFSQGSHISSSSFNSRILLLRLQSMLGAIGPDSEQGLAFCQSLATFTSPTQHSPLQQPLIVTGPFFWALMLELSMWRSSTWDHACCRCASRHSNHYCTLMGLFPLIDISHHFNSSAHMQYIQPDIAYPPPKTGRKHFRKHNCLHNVPVIGRGQFFQ